MFRNLFRKKPSPPSARPEMVCPTCGQIMLLCLCSSPATTFGSAGQAGNNLSYQLGLGPTQLDALRYQDRLQRMMAGTTYAPAPPPAPLPTADTMGPIRAWRLWRIRNDRLWSVAYSETQWQPGRPLKAAEGPDQRGVTGVYAVKAKDHAFPYEGDTVLGEVGLWGRVIEHERGYRAEYAYPIRLVWRAPKTMPGFPQPAGELRRLQALADVYGIPLTVEETP